MTSPRRSRVAAPLVLAAAGLFGACGGARPAPEPPYNQRAESTGPHEIAPSCFEIDTAVIDAALSDWAALIASAKVRWLAGGEVPGLDKGKAWPGIAVSSIQPGSLYARMGLVDGDVVYAYNGNSLAVFEPLLSLLFDAELARELPADASPASFVRMFESSTDGGALSLSVVRRGQPIWLIQVRPGAPAGACTERPRLRDHEAEEVLWTEADWHAETARQAAKGAAIDAARAEQQAIIDGITKVNESTYELASAITTAGMREALTTRARLVPSLTGGSPDGVRIYAVHPRSVHHALGLANGDTLRTIAGVAVTTAEAALDRLARLAEQPSSTIELTRRDKAVTLQYTVR